MVVRMGRQFVGTVTEGFKYRGKGIRFDLPSRLESITGVLLTDVLFGFS